MTRSDRPLSRKLVRLAFQALGPSRAHRQDIWPGLDIDRPASRVTWRGRPLLQPVLFSAILPQGAGMIAVVGSGPSLRGQRIEALGDGTAILCNGAALLAQRIRPLAVAVEDERFVFRHHEMLAALPHDIPLMLSPAALRAWAERGTEPLQDRTVALIENLARPLGGKRRRLDDPALDHLVQRGHGAAITTDPDKGVVIVGTVAFSALQIALSALPQQIVLAGIDLNNHAEPRFYETTDRAPSGLGAGQDRILAGFALALEVAVQKHLNISCASESSSLLTIGYSLKLLSSLSSSGDYSS